MAKFFLFLSFFVLMTSSAFSDDSLTLTTYYPAPNGNYDSMKSGKMCVGTGCTLPASGLLVSGKLGVVGTSAAGIHVGAGSTIPGSMAVDGADVLIQGDLGVVGIIYGNGSGITGIIPGAQGGNTQVQYNNNNNLDGASGITVSNSEQNLTVTGQTETASLKVTGDVWITSGAVNGRVLTSNGAGKATWQPAPGGSGSVPTVSCSSGSAVTAINATTATCSPVGGGGSVPTITCPSGSAITAINSTTATCTAVSGSSGGITCSTSCNSSYSGSTRYCSSTLQYCNGSSWVAVPTSGSGGGTTGEWKPLASLGSSNCVSACAGYGLSSAFSGGKMCEGNNGWRGASVTFGSMGGYPTPQYLCTGTDNGSTSPLQKCYCQ